MYHFTVLAVTLLLFTVVTVSASDPVLDLGDHLFVLGNYYAAITEYKRFLFFNSDHPQASEAQFKIGLAYRAQKWWAEAAEAMIAAVQRTTETELQAERRVELAVTLIASGAYDLALLELIKIDMQSQSAQITSTRSFFAGGCLSVPVQVGTGAIGVSRHISMLSPVQQGLLPRLTHFSRRHSICRRNRRRRQGCFPPFCRGWGKLTLEIGKMG